MIPCFPCRLGRAEKHGFEYYRHGTLSLYAALDVKTGKVHGKTARRHTSEDFLAFLKEIVDRTPVSKEIHIVLDNLSAHKTKAWPISLSRIRAYAFTSRLPIRPGLIRSKSGSPKSSAT